MKPLDDAKKTLQGTVAGIDPRVIAVVLILVPILAVVAVVLYKRYKARKDAQKAAAPPVLAPAPAAADQGAQVGASQLRQAWKRFLGKLPSHYGRSILNFEQFVVFGDAASGKSTMADAYTDWRRQAKQFIASQADDKDLPIYLTSNAVVMEIPAKILHDSGPACRRALENLWKPLYARRSPTVVVVADARRLREDPPQALEELAETIRGKINLLSSIRQRSLEVRVVLTHLDAFEGYADLASFCRAQSISMRVALPAKDDVGACLEAWLEDMRQHLPRALTALDADAYRRVVSFLRQAPPLLPPLRHFLTSLYAHEALSFDPVRGGLFLASDPPGAPSPLRRASERGPGPDPRLRHLTAAALVSSGVMTFLGIAFVHQQGLWEKASDSLKSYSPTDAYATREQEKRKQIVAFTARHGSWLDMHPNFFEGPRERMRAELSERIRSQLLVPRLREVAQVGLKGRLPMRQSRSLYCLALIHSDKHDMLGILQRKDKDGRNRLNIWEAMTGIQGDLIEDYLENSDAPSLDVVSFDIENEASSLFDTPKPWAAFLRDLRAAMSHGDLKPAGLEALQQQAEDLEGNLDRVRNVDIVLDILKDSAADNGAEPRMKGAAAGGSGERQSDEVRASLMRVAAIYEQQFQRFLRDQEAFRDLDVNEFANVLHSVRTAGLEINKAGGGLDDLVRRLQDLSDEGRHGDDEAKHIALGDSKLDFNEGAWAAVIRKSKASLLVQDFMHNAAQRSVFFGATSDGLAPAVWNPAGDAAAIFTGRSVLEGRYTAAAYEAHVRKPVLGLRALLSAPKAAKQGAGAQGDKQDAEALVSEQDQAQLEEFVRRGVAEYANEYDQQASRFVKGFTLTAPSVEALRVALAQMSDKAGRTTFDDFLRIVDQNTTLDVRALEAKEEEPMLAPMKKVVEDFAHWHEVVDGNGAAPRIVQYKEILGRMLGDLEGQAASPEEATGKAPAKDAAPPAEGGEKAPGETLEQALTPTGRLVLKDLSRDAGAYPALIRGWIRTSGLPQDQQGPFLAPITHISTIGRQDIQSVVWRVFRRDFMPELQRVAALFPFDPAAEEEVTPQQLVELFHPKEGRVYDLFRRYMEPLSQVDSKSGFRSLPSVRQSLALPEKMYPIVNAVGVLSARLWDDKGKPLPLRYTVATVPLGRGPSETNALTLVYFNVGSGSLFNFNQKPTTRALSLDWSVPSTSQVGVQLTNTESREKTDPDPVVVEGSCFSFLRLLRKAKQPPSPVSQPAGARLYTWDIPVAGGDKVRAQLVLEEDPWETFALGKAVRAASAP